MKDINRKDLENILQVIVSAFVVVYGAKRIYSDPTSVGWLFIVSGLTIIFFANYQYKKRKEKKENQ